MSISYVRSLFLTRTGVHSGLEKYRFHQAEEPRSPDLRKGDQTFVFALVPIKERSWLRFIKCAGSKCYAFSSIGYFFQIVILNARLWFAFSPPSVSSTALVYDELCIELNDIKGQTFAR